MTYVAHALEILIIAVLGLLYFYIAVRVATCAYYRSRFEMRTMGRKNRNNRRVV